MVDSQIFVGDQLCVMLHEHVMLIGGEKLQQEDFLAKLSACMPLEDTGQLDEETPLNFLGRALEYNRAERSISLHLPSAFYLQLLRRYSLEDATARDSPRDELERVKHQDGRTSSWMLQGQNFTDKHLVTCSGLA